MSQDSKTKIDIIYTVSNMCLAVPGLVESIDGDFADVDFGGVRKQVCVTLLPELQVGEYVIVHTGYAIERMKPEEAKKTLALWDEMVELAQNMDQS
jgi:hydrogenase expression/formation protein HypC